MRRELEAFELVQVWIADDAIEPLATEQFRRMRRVFRTTSIPLHVILLPEGPDGRELVRFAYSPTMDPEDYLEFLAKGRAAHDAALAEGAGKR